VGAFVGHYRCLTCPWDFTQPLAFDPAEAREFLQEIAAWQERHRPSLRLHRLYLRAVYGAGRGPRLDLLHRAQAQLIRERALAHPWNGENGQPGMEITGPSGATLQIAFALVEARWCLACVASRHTKPALPTPEDEAYVTWLFLTPDERRIASRSVEPEPPSTVVYVVRLDAWLRSLSLGPGW